MGFQQNAFQPNAFQMSGAPPPGPVPPDRNRGRGATRYQIRLKDQSGALVAVITDMLRVSYTKRVNMTDTHELTLMGDSAVIGGFVLDAQIEVWRRNIAAIPPIPWTLDYEGFHRTPIFSTTETSRSLFYSYGRGYLDLIGRRAILYPSGSAGAGKSGAGEDVIKEYVEENAGPSAIAPPRKFAGATPGLTIEASGGAGIAWTGSRAYRNLLDVIHEIAHATEVDFECVGTGPATFEFRARATPLGTDRTTTGINPATGLNAAGNAPMIFSLGFGNMQAPSYSVSRIEEVTAVVALGQGLADDRELIEVQDAAIAESPWNRREITRQANTESTTAGLTSIAESALEEFNAREDFSFRVVQTPARLYGRDYFLGDLVTARYLTLERNLQISAVTVTVEKGLERIDVEMRTHGA